jgi:cellulose synthase/poly-beta-1,6-N-acetylglucosamine synthase-like glycosyltransferase
MPAWLWTWIVLVGLAGLVWTSRHFMISAHQRRADALTPDSPGAGPDAPLVSVLVSAKDEEANIAACISSMLAQDYPDFEMIVCNDRSSDRTGRIVADLARQDDRLRLVEVHHLPEGWSGKCHGMYTAACAARGDWLCMTDADCRQLSPRTLSAAMRYARDSRADLLSVLPVLEMKGFWENVVQPVCSGVMMIWFHPDRVNDPARRAAYANGAFMLMRRGAYEVVGTHQAIRHRLMEDLHLAARVKQAGLRLRVVRGDGLYVVRMYTSFGQILRGWSRIFFGTFGTLPRLSASIAIMFCMGLLPYISAAVGFALAAAGGPHAGLWLGLGGVGAAAAAMQLSVIYRFYRFIGARADLAWTYPLGCAVTLAALGMSLSKHRPGARVVWRGTTYSGASQKS